MIYASQLYIRNRGAIIFITCSIVSLVPTFLASAITVYANTFGQGSLLPGLFSLGASMLYVTPIFIFGMGDFLFYTTAVKHQEIEEHEKWEAIAAFFLTFVVMYIFYLFSIDLIHSFLQILSHGL